MKKLSRITIPILVTILLLAPYTPSSIMAVGQSATVTVITTIDKNHFNPHVVEALKGKIIYTADLAPIAIIQLPEAAVSHLKNIDGVLHVSNDAEIHALSTGNIGVMAPPPGKGKPGKGQPAQQLPWGVDYIDAEKVWPLGLTGFVDVNGDGDSEIEVAVIDTGIDTDHPDLASNIKWGVAVSHGRISNNYNDKNGHGTHVSGTIAALDNNIGVVGVAPSVEIYMIKALGNSGSGTWSDLIIAIDLAVKGPDGVIDSDGDGVIVGDPEDDAPEVISMSLGGGSPPPELHDMIIQAYNYGITIVAAAGNEGASQPSYPAAYPEVIAVGAIDSNGNVPSWSNRLPEVSAPGVDILSTYPDDTYNTLSGTSMATPHVAGTVALMQAARLANGLPLLPPGTENDTGTSTVRGILHTTSTDMGTSGYDELYGYGVINAYQAVLTATG